LSSFFVATAIAVVTIAPVLFKNSIPFTVLVRWSDSL
jgi:hypothetical protein